MLFNASKGFTLVEMAIVIVVIGLLLTHSLRPLSSIVEQQRIQRTDQTLEEIKEALLGYTVLNKRLPCPADSADIGKENIALCGREGYLPWADLAVGRYDGWGNQFRYRADTEYSKSTGIPTSLRTANTNRLRVEDRIANNLTSEEEDKSGKKYTRLAAVIYSYGKNYVGEEKNSDNNHVYVQGNYFEDKWDSANTFDDRVTWLPKYLVSKRLIEAKKWP